MMKIRNGFVSNSSSSSFIVKNKVPLTYESILKKIKNHEFMVEIDLHVDEAGGNVKNFLIDEIRLKDKFQVENNELKIIKYESDVNSSYQAKIAPSLVAKWLISNLNHKAYYNQKLYYLIHHILSIGSKKQYHRLAKILISLFNKYLDKKTKKFLYYYFAVATQLRVIRLNRSSLYFNNSSAANFYYFKGTVKNIVKIIKKIKNEKIRQSLYFKKLLENSEEFISTPETEANKLESILDEIERFFIENYLARKSISDNRELLYSDGYSTPAQIFYEVLNKVVDNRDILILKKLKFLLLSINEGDVKTVLTFIYDILSDSLYYSCVAELEVGDLDYDCVSECLYYNSRILELIFDDVEECYP